MSWLSPIDGPILAPIWGEPDEDGARPVIGFEPGYRLNIPPELMAAELEPLRVTPPTPLRVFAGDASPWPKTVFLLFADEAAARASPLAACWVDS